MDLPGTTDKDVSIVSFHYLEEQRVREKDPLDNNFYVNSSPFEHITHCLRDIRPAADLSSYSLSGRPWGKWQELHDIQRVSTNHISRKTSPHIHEITAKSTHFFSLWHWPLQSYIPIYSHLNSTIVCNAYREMHWLCL